MTAIILNKTHFTKWFGPWLSSLHIVSYSQITSWHTSKDQQPQLRRRGTKSTHPPAEPGGFHSLVTTRGFLKMLYLDDTLPLGSDINQEWGILMSKDDPCGVQHHYYGLQTERWAVLCRASQNLHPHHFQSCHCVIIIQILAPTSGSPALNIYVLFYSLTKQ